MNKEKAKDLIDIAIGGYGLGTLLFIFTFTEEAIYFYGKKFDIILVLSIICMFYFLGSIILDVRKSRVVGVPPTSNDSPTCKIKRGDL